MIETRIDSLDFLAQLKNELIIGYTANSKTVGNIVVDLLAYQAHSNPVLMGTIEPTVTRSIAVEQDNIYSVLMKLRGTVGGYIYVDNDHKLNWLNDIGEAKGQQIRYKKNIIGIERNYDFSNFANRIYAYGAGEGTARIRLSQATGYHLDYVEDVDSQAEYGLCVRVIVDKTITHPDTLYEWAVRQLEEMAEPKHSYTVDMVNLAAMGWDFEDLQLGSFVRVIDEDLGININARIVKITRDLSDPKNIKVEISNPGKDIVDSLSAVYDNQQLESHIATKIGAGQVVVLGDFVVSDWVTGGSTTIKGSSITAGTITATQLSTGEIITNSAQIKNAIITDAKISSLSANKISGQIVDAQIANISFAKITNVYIQDAQIASLSANKISGQIVDAQIASIQFAKITNVSVQDAQIASLSANKITGQIADYQILSVSFAKITNVQIQDAQIVSLNASKITGSIIKTQIASVSAATIQDTSSWNLNAAYITSTYYYGSYSNIANLNPSTIQNRPYCLLGNVTAYSYTTGSPLKHNQAIDEIKAIEFDGEGKFIKSTLPERVKVEGYANPDRVVQLESDSEADVYRLVNLKRVQTDQKEIKKIDDLINKSFDKYLPDYEKEVSQTGLYMELSEMGSLSICALQELIKRVEALECKLNQ